MLRRCSRENNKSYNRHGYTDAAINLRVCDPRIHKSTYLRFACPQSAHVIADRVLLPPATRKPNRHVHQVRFDAPISPDNNNIGSREDVTVTWTRRVGGWERRRGGCNPWIMARVTLASSLTLVSLRLRSDTATYRKEEDQAREKNASLLARTLLHHRRAAAMADDERSTFPHRLREREVNLPCSSKGLLFLSFLLSAGF